MHLCTPKVILSYILKKAPAGAFYITTNDANDDVFYDATRDDVPTGAPNRVSIHPLKLTPVPESSLHFMAKRACQVHGL